MIKFMATKAASGGELTDRQVRVIASSKERDRGGDIVEPTGCDLTNYLKNPVVLRDHDKTQVIGQAQIEITPNDVRAVITFPPLGASEKADESCALAKNGDLRGVSIGFIPTEFKPLKDGGDHITKWELLEISMVSIPMNANTVVIEKSFADFAKPKVGASCNLDVAPGADWNDEAVTKSILDHCGIGTDKADLNLARKAFLVYDSANPNSADSYKYPFAKVVDGRLVADSAGLEASKAILSASSLSGDVVEKANSVVRFYEAKMTKSQSAKIANVEKVKDLFDVGRLAQTLSDLGWIQAVSEWEAEIEGDGSKVPAMLGDALRVLGEALIAMTQEEVSELLSALKDGGEAGEKSKSAVLEKGFFKKAMAAAKVKSGREFSASNAKSIKGACKTIKGAHDTILGLLETDSGDTSEDETDDEAADTEKAMPGAMTKQRRQYELTKRQALVI